MLYLGDYAEDATIDFKWSTNGADGASITRATNGTVSVYKANSTTQATTGVTDTEDFDSLTGIHHCRIATTDSFYEAGNDYQVVLSGATIDGKTVNAVLAHFSIQNRYQDKADYALSSAAANSVADALLKRDWTAVSGEAARSMLNALRFLRNKWSVSGSTLTVMKENDSTTAWTATVTDDAGADPVTGVDPA